MSGESPSGVIDTSDVDEVRNYLARHEIHLLFESLAADLVRARPEDPVRHLYNALGKLLSEPQQQQQQQSPTS